MTLPREVWAQIFIELDKKTLKSCLEVSKVFREIIYSNTSLMRNLPLCFLNDSWIVKLPFVRKYGHCVREVKFDDCGFSSISEVTYILKATPNVEKLIFFNCYLKSENENEGESTLNVEPLRELNGEDEDNEQSVQDFIGNHDVLVPAIIDQPQNSVQPQVEPGTSQIVDEGSTERAIDVPILSHEPESEFDDIPLKLNRLVSLQVDSSSIAEFLIRDLKNCTKLVYLKMTFFYQQPNFMFTDFICSQTCLTELYLVGWSDMVFKSIFNEDINHRINFRLKKFMLECEMNYHSNFSTFLQLQSDSLEEFDLCGYNINFHYYRVIFNHFHKLKKITLPIDWFLTDERRNDIRNCRIESLRELNLVGSNDDITIFKTVMSIFPNIKILKAENLMYFSLHNFIENYENIRHLKIENFRVEVLAFVKLKSLKILEVNYLYPMALSFFWENLAENNPNIEQIIIRDIGHFKLTESIQTEISIILNSLRLFSDLKYCEIISNPQEPLVNGDEDNNDNRNHANELPFFKIIVENNASKQRTIKVSQYFAVHCPTDLIILRDTFKDCDVILI